MKKNIILLRGINVSVKNKIQMEALRRLLNEPNFKNIQTCVFTLLNWIARTKLTNMTIEKKLNVIATTRNLRTTLKSLALATI
ncbi:DUF1697 domain-containing protein [Polaribacter sp.]|nr:DUF1697 domain-containing protein [Polaribacter sp.]